MNEFVSWCWHLLVSFLFHTLTSLHPPSFHRNDFSTCSLVQTAPTTINVSWIASQEVSVTGYRVRYSLPGGTETVTEVLVSSSTGTDITNLQNGMTYTFSVEVITAPGVLSMTITLDKWWLLNLLCQ